MEYQTIANLDGTISIVPVNQAQGIMVPAYKTSQLNLADQINQGPRNIGPLMTASETMSGSILPPDPRQFLSIFPTNFKTGIGASSAARNVTPFGTSVDNIQGFTDKEDFSESEEKSGGIADLFKSLLGFFAPGFNALKNFEGKDYQRYTPGFDRDLARSGIYKIGDFNQPIGLANDFYDPMTQTNRFDRAAERYKRTGSMRDLFASSRSGAEFFRKRREIKAARQKALEAAAKAKREFNPGSDPGDNNRPSFTGAPGGDFATFDTSGKDYGPFSR